jgi:hypothetical protein
MSTCWTASARQAGRANTNTRSLRHAARISDVGLQMVRDWVLRFNAEGPGGLIDRKAHRVDLHLRCHLPSPGERSGARSATMQYRRDESAFGEIAQAIAPDAHAVLLVDQVGWHLSHRLIIPPNMTLVLLPPKCPELNHVPLPAMSEADRTYLQRAWVFSQSGDTHRGSHEGLRPVIGHGTNHRIPFYPNCGSTMFWDPPSYSDFIGIPVGVFADLGFPQPDVSIFMPHKHPWVAVPDRVPGYEAHSGRSLR